MKVDKLIITCPIMSIDFSISSFIPQLKYGACFGPGYLAQQRLQFLWNHKSFELSLKKLFVLFQDLVSYKFGGLKDGVEIV